MLRQGGIWLPLPVYWSVPGAMSMRKGLSFSEVPADSSKSAGVNHKRILRTELSNM